MPRRGATRWLGDLRGAKDRETGREGGQPAETPFSGNRPLTSRYSVSKLQPRIHAPPTTHHAHIREGEGASRAIAKRYLRISSLSPAFGITRGGGASGVWVAISIRWRLARRPGTPGRASRSPPAARLQAAYRPSSQPSSACFRSARMSWMDSSPTLRRTRPSCSPPASRSSRGIMAWVIEAGCSTSDSVPG